MASVRRHVTTGSTDLAQLYETLVGDDACGFWLTQRPGGRTISRLGIGVPESGALFEPGGPLSALTSGGTSSSGGWVGWMGYDSYKSSWLRVDRYVSFEHSTRAVWAHAPEHEIDAWELEVREALDALPPAPSGGRGTSLLAAHARHSPREYRSMIEGALDSIRAGDAYQLCLTTRFSIDGSVDPRDVHSRLATADAPYTALIRTGDRALIAASPEQFLSLSASGVLSTSPIKGTRRRSADAGEDARFARELQSDAKERAENLMIVDLMRNDLSRVCEPGSVAVARLFDVEPHTYVHQLVSQVTGRVRAGATLTDVVAATFPAGSMTGAPKLRAMEILDELERAPRGAYSGCFGWIGDDGAMDLAMTIRSVVLDAHEAYVGAGGGLTIDSDPDFEIAEVALKAQAPLAALDARLPREWEERLRGSSRG